MNKKNSRKERWKSYRDYPAQNYSDMADFWVSPDHALMEREPKGYFTEGTAFELIVQDYCESSNLFGEEFVIGDNLEGSVPDGLVKALEEGKSKEEIESELIVLTKDGKENKTKKRQHEWVRFALADATRMPISKAAYTNMQVMMKNLFKLDFDGFLLKDILREAIWQYPIYWQVGEVKKKCLLDCAITIKNADDEEVIVPFDIKTCANLTNFERFMKSKYWIQNFHYVEGVRTKSDNVHPGVVFLVVEKEPPFRARRYEVDPSEIAEGENTYRLLSSQHGRWVADGRQPVGIMPPKFIKPYYTR